MTVRHEEYMFSCDLKKRRVFEEQQVSRALLNFRWTKHIPMGCDQTGKGHQEDISAIDIDDGDQMLLFGSHSGSVSVAKYKYLDRKKWKKPMTLKLAKQSLKTIKWCPIDLRLFMVTTASNWMRVCDSTMEKVVHGKQFEGDVYFDWNEYNMTNSKVAVADGGRSMKIIDFRVGMDLPQSIYWNDEPIDVVQWYPSKHHYLYAGRRDGTIGLFDIRSTRGAIAEKSLHKSQIYGLKISADGHRLISADRSGYIHVADTWDFSTKFDFSCEFDPLMQRRPNLEFIYEKDFYVATNFEKLTIIRFSDNDKSRRNPDFREVEAKVLWDKPFIFRKSSYEIITGFNYNHLNILSLDRSTKDQDEV